MSYRYGGRMNPKTKKRCLIGFVAASLMMGVLSTTVSTYAWWHPYVYHLPDNTNGFSWEEVKGVVNEGLKRYESEERKQYGSNYYVDENISKGGDYWESYQEDWSSEGGGRITISRFDFDKTGGIIYTWHKYGEGDWVRSVPYWWGQYHYGDDFAMYKRLFSSTIPVRDSENAKGDDGKNHESVRTSLKDINVNKLGGANGILVLLNENADHLKSQTKENMDGSLRTRMSLETGLLQGDFKKVVDSIQNPKQLVIPYIESLTSPINPDPMKVNFGGKVSSYTREEMEKGSDSKIIKDKEDALVNIHKEMDEIYKRSDSELKEVNQQLKKLSEKTQTDSRESIVDAKLKKEQLHRINYELEKKSKVKEVAEEGRQNAGLQVLIDKMASDRQKGQNMMHMPTKEEFEKIIRERREKYST